MGWKNDCQDPDLCQCRSDIILCRNISEKPKIYFENPNEIKQFCISAFYLNEVGFLDVFIDSELFSLFRDVRINCSLIHQKRSQVGYMIEAPGELKYLHYQNK